MTDRAPEERRRRRQLFPALSFVWGFLLVALVIAGAIVLAIYLTGGFGEGGE